MPISGSVGVDDGCSVCICECVVELDGGVCFMNTESGVCIFTSLTLSHMTAMETDTCKYTHDSSKNNHDNNMFLK